MVGEIRDYETAETPVKAALTGHLVLSTLHTNDAPSAVTRLLNMGAFSRGVLSAHYLGAGQLRRVCPQCKVPVEARARTRWPSGPEAAAAALTCYIGSGCEACSGTGYEGRMAIYEVLPLSPELRGLVLNGGAQELKQVAVQQGMRTLRMSALAKLQEGIHGARSGARHVQRLTPIRRRRRGRARLPPRVPEWRRLWCG